MTMLRKQYLLTLLLVASLVLNAVPVNGQIELDAGDPFAAGFAPSNDPVEVFGGFQRAGRDEVFAQGLSAIIGDQGDTSDDLDAQGVYFYERFRARSKHLFDASVERGIEINRIAYEKHKGAAVSRPRALPRSMR